MNKRKIHNKDDWAHFAIGYLRLAELACLEIIEKKHQEKGLETNFTMEHIYIPALFNLKHGIEILLKTLGIEFLNKEILDQSDYSHDIEEIFSRLRKEIREERLKNAVLEFEKKNPDRKGDLSGKEIFDELERIVRKYHSLDFLKEKIGTDYTIKDPDNTALRYPENNLSICINYKKLSKKFTKDDVGKSMVESARLETILWQLYVLLYEEQLKQLK
ncbi:hypothetical protein C4571_00035 [Candidatus Parcubacteria bacterium]|nr:MAG: hypothetical protein C4571_00035 [Candidatus Parcubacteria bacterium]